MILLSVEYRRFFRVFFRTNVLEQSGHIQNGRLLFSRCTRCKSSFFSKLRQTLRRIRLRFETRVRKPADGARGWRLCVCAGKGAGRARKINTQFTLPPPLPLHGEISRVRFMVFAVYTAATAAVPYTTFAIIYPPPSTL